MKVDIGIEQQNRDAVADALNRLLADEYVLLTKTRNYHWNVVGMQFNDLHKFFEGQYDQLTETVDDIAERARQLGKPSVATLQEFGKAARLKEHPGVYPPADQMLSNLLADHETIIKILRSDLAASAEKYGDMGTSDFLTGLMEQHEKMAWMLRSFLSKTVS